MNNNDVINATSISKSFKNSNDSLLKIGWIQLIKTIFKNKRNKFDKQNFYALKNISFSLKKGESVGIVGLNGSGKSTLLQIICGTIQPSSGQVTTKGRIGAMLELGSGFNPDFTGIENIFLNASLLGLTKEQTKLKLSSIIEFADIGDYINQPIKTYSSGMKMRLAFSIIANVDASTLIVDEALAVGDIIFTQKCMVFFKNFIKKGTLILVSHDISAVRMICQRCIWLEKGMIKYDGPCKRGTDLYLQSTHNVSCSNPSTDSFPEKKFYTNKNLSEYSLKKSGIKQEFGEKNVEILEATLKDNLSNKKILHASGNEVVNLNIDCLFHRAISKPIFGFILRNRLGLEILAENTQNIELNLKNKKDSIIKCTFTFVLPVLSNGQYTISVAVAEDSTKSHLIHHWLHDAITINFSNPINCQGLVGLSMKSISIK